MVNINLVNNFDQNNIIIDYAYNALNPLTRRAYKVDFDEFINFVQKDIHQITVNDVLKYISFLECKNYKSSSINRKIYSLSKIFNLYKIAGLLKSNPIIELNRIKKITRKINPSIIVPLTIDEIKSVTAKNKPINLIIKTLATTGLRISELINIKNDDLFFLEGFIKVRVLGKGKKERFVFLKKDFFDEIKKNFNNSLSPYLFHTKTGRPFNRVNLHNQIKKEFLKTLGKSVHPHALRHFFATYKIHKEKQDIKSVSLYLGHSTTATTLNMYVDSFFTPCEMTINEL